ncbi:dipeptide ABC transporter ATP-binding protein [Merismopedia glauca]|uniref:ABC transporter ATP-binding protein n=1 Tax=Merismopedia glauca CCAP 1448/3 TaxID=1296344 RepID=A0A2T1C293_9CYAN|nr:ABC transporter ATP-binding protein [Merismopedia glauca]PSB02233.1 ABC transporter ATP-binding protein [Merismopedia glauca CCAP 1448/3]
MTNASETSTPILVIQHLRVAYPSSRSGNGEPNWAVDDVSLQLSPGERVGLVGESGCGKSTLGRAVMRLLPSGSTCTGKIEFTGKSVLDMNVFQLRQFRGEAVALIFQDPMTRLDPLMTIGEHCLETLKAHQPQLSNREAQKKALETLEAVQIKPERWNQFPHEFSGGMRQRVAIALALLLEPKLIVADEPTTSLDVLVSEEILNELTRLCRERNMALLLISHDLVMVRRYCDRVGVMYQGKIVENKPTEALFTNPEDNYTRSLLEAALHLQAVGEKLTEVQVETEPTIHQYPEPILEVKDLKQHYTLERNLIERLFYGESETIKAVDGVDLKLYPGEVLGLVGASGCGKSTLSRSILQLVAPSSGSVKFQCEELTKLSVPEMRARRRQIQMVFQDPHACLNPLMTVGEGIGDPLLIHNLATPEVAKKEVLKMLDRVGLTPVEEYYNRFPSDLSGGQQQRVAIARALITNPKLLICDEPVSMLDASVQTQVLQLMQDLKQEFDLTYLFITHDLWVARFLCDRIAVMQAGQIVEMGDTRDIFSNPQAPYTQELLRAASILR